MNNRPSRQPRAGIEGCMSSIRVWSSRSRLRPRSSRNWIEHSRGTTRQTGKGEKWTGFLSTSWPVRKWIRTKGVGNVRRNVEGIERDEGYVYIPRAVTVIPLRAKARGGCARPRAQKLGSSYVIHEREEGPTDVCPFEMALGLPVREERCPWQPREAQ